MFAEDWPFDQEPPVRPERVVLPPGVDGLAPGAELAGVLEGVDRRELNGHELVVVLRARARQIAHLQAELYADMWELGFTTPGDESSPPVRIGEWDEFVSDEVAAALVLTPRTGDREVGLAYQLSQLPQVLEALRAGRIDLTRARVFCNETIHLDPDQAREVADSLIGEASGWTARQLGGRLRRRCQENDPDAARERYEEAVEERRVEGYPNPDGTADVCGRSLPPDRAAAVMGRLHTLAKEMNQAGDPRPLDQIRADLFLQILEGNHPAAGDDHVSSGGGVELRVGLETLMGLDDRSGEIPGWGPVISDLARQIAHQQRQDQWRFVVTHPDTGLPLATGITRRRPTAHQQRHLQARNPTCIFPGCPTPAARCHVDHTIPRQHHGPTTLGNLGPGCPRHHLRTKHQAGWKLTQPQPGTFHWTSPRGHHYTVRPPPD